eukprot:TRINITY_DN1991_c0_g1_i1.p1 TRINITY_DN1991_c0_g1~~TRINITY_DN1991_c0_g1_i1.p1  ORF type:complete len:174 (-),score=36.92 TRINITY_DN1991_c0_g1_i1:23-544(-)
MGASDELQNLLDAIETNGRYDWLTVGETYAQELGFESRKACMDAASACDSSVADLEVNAFYGGVRNKPTKNVRNVEVGRVAVCTYGEDYGKQMVITDVVDQARVVVMGVDGMLSDIKPKSFPIRRIHLTHVRVPNMSQRGHRVKKVKQLLSASLDDIKASLAEDRIVEADLKV